MSYSHNCHHLFPELHSSCSIALTKAQFEPSWCVNLAIEFTRVLVRHVDENPNQVMLGGFGSGGAEELKEALEDESVMYGLGKICHYYGTYIVLVLCTRFFILET